MEKYVTFTFYAIKKRESIGVRCVTFCSILDCAFAYVDTIATGEHIIAQVDNKITLDGVYDSLLIITM